MSPELWLACRNERKDDVSLREEDDYEYDLDDDDDGYDFLDDDYDYDYV